ncbi:hypothetical protein GCM10023317_88690 [Actinopolymorpha pittospori]
MVRRRATTKRGTCVRRTNPPYRFANVTARRTFRRWALLFYTIPTHRRQAVIDRVGAVRTGLVPIGRASVNRCLTMPPFAPVRVAGPLSAARTAPERESEFESESEFVRQDA